MSDVLERVHIQSIVAALLDLHKLLLADEEREYLERNLLTERPPGLLHVVMTHPQFAWLRTLSTLAAELDSRLEARSGDAPPDVPARQLVDYVFGSGEAALASPFRTKLNAKIQESPDIAGAYATLRRAIKSL